MQIRQGAYYFSRVAVGIVITVFGLLGTAVGILAILDPVGAKMSDDADPLGTPPSFSESAAVTFLFLLIAGAGIWLMTYKSKRVE